MVSLAGSGLNITEKRAIIECTIDALSSIVEPRYFKTERGYQGAFYCSLRNQLQKKIKLPEEAILEMEYQKSSRHDMTQRPDIVFHIPASENGIPVDKGNFAAYELKPNASSAEAQTDFKNLDELFSRLNYELGFFINIDSGRDFMNEYRGIFKNRIHGLAVKLSNENIIISHSFFKNERLKNEMLLKSIYR